MPNLKTSIKDLRKNKSRNINNNRLRKRVKRAIKKHSVLTEEGKVTEAEKNLKNIYKVLDKAAKKNVIKKGKADRIKSNLTKDLNKLTKDNVKTAKKGS